MHLIRTTFMIYIIIMNNAQHSRSQCSAMLMTMHMHMHMHLHMHMHIHIPMHIAHATVHKYGAGMQLLWLCILVKTLQNCQIVREEPATGECDTHLNISHSCIFSHITEAGRWAAQCVVQGSPEQTFFSSEVTTKIWPYLLDKNRARLFYPCAD